MNKSININILKDSLNENLEQHLSLILPNHSIKDVYQYALFPPGKLFRPLLVAAIAYDIDGNFSNNHQLLASVIEMHHAYTLIHDDLPCMDDDDKRRDKPSTHIAFGEWQALLVGDGLLAASYQLLSKIHSPQQQEIFRFISWALGPKGLIQGQVMDLSNESHNSFDNILTTHKLKTSRLIQAALIGSLLLSGSYKNKKLYLDIYRLGHNLGISFQLLDDLSEIDEGKIGIHEQEINPFFQYPDQAKRALLDTKQRVEKILKKHKMNNLEILVEKYYLKNMRLFSQL